MTFLPVDLTAFKVGDQVRYQPGIGTYGYEVELRQSSDGRLAAVVVGFSKTRVRVKIQADLGRIVTRCVDPKSLQLVEPRSTGNVSEVREVSEVLRHGDA